MSVFLINLGQNTNFENQIKRMALTLFQITVFAVVCLVTWPVNESEVRVELVLIETSLLFLC